MTQAITDKTNVLVLWGDVEIYINEAEKLDIKNAIKAGAEMLEVQGKLIMKHSIRYIISAAEKREGDMLKRGGWRCAKGNVHEKQYSDCSC